MSTGRNLWMIVVSAVATALTIAVAMVPAASASQGCENEARRLEQSSTFLSDCRAYELVSPLNAQPGSLLGEYKPFGIGRMRETVAAMDGERFIYSSWFNPPESTSFSRSYLVTRGSAGWTTESPNPSQSTQGPSILCTPWPVGFSADLSVVAISGSEEGCGHPEPPAAADEPEGVRNIYLRDSSTRSFSLGDPPPVTGSAANAYYEAASVDGSHILFNDAALLTPEAPPEGAPTATGNLYEWAAGAVHLVTLLPNGTPVGGSLANGGLYSAIAEESFGGAASITKAVSSDGERVAFYVGGTTVEGSSLYLRMNATHPQSHINHAGECSEPTAACTVQVDASQTANASTGVKFRWATPDGSRIFFTDEGRLTVDSTAASGKPDLYEYDLSKRAGDRLTDLTANGSEPAGVLGVSGASEDGSYVYFVAEGALTPPTEENANHEHAEAGKPNLYVRHGGVDMFIATLSAAGEYATLNTGFGPAYADAEDWVPVTKNTSGFTNDFGVFKARVSANGRFLAFNSERSLTGYDNLPAGGSEICAHITGGDEPCPEIYLYDASANKLSCASCDQNGAPPLGPVQIFGEEEDSGGGGSPINLGYYQRNLSNDGRVFFSSPDPLVPGDINGQLNVYEYFEGQQHLISSGTSNAPSMFADASADGRNVFFVTGQGLVRGDTDSQESVYDARVDGGLASQNEAVVPPSCEALEACRSPLSEPPAQLLSGSAALVGPGNLAVAPEQPGSKQPAVKKPAKCKKGFVRRNDKCVKTRRVKQKGTRRKHATKPHGAKRSLRAGHATYTNGRAK